MSKGVSLLNIDWTPLRTCTQTRGNARMLGLGLMFRFRHTVGSALPMLWRSYTNGITMAECYSGNGSQPLKARGVPVMNHCVDDI